MNSQDIVRQFEEMRKEDFSYYTVVNFFLNFAMYFAETEKKVEQCSYNPLRTSDNAITLKEFHEQTHIMHPVTAEAYFKKDPAFLSACGELFGKTLLIKKNAAVRYLANSNSDKIRFRARRYLKQQNQLALV